MATSYPHRGAPLPERPNTFHHHVIAVPEKGTIEAVFINPEWLGLWIHYDQTAGKHGQNVPCTGADDCPFHRPPIMQKPRWCGYIGAWICDRDPKRGGLKVLALTEGLARQLLELPEHADGLRGMGVALARRGTKRNDPVDIMHTGRPKKELPPPFDVIPHLLNLYGVRELLQLQDRQQAAQLLRDGILKFKTGGATA